MALKLLSPKTQPYGWFDALDSETTSFKGGEVAMLTYVSIASSTDKHAADVDDGYVSTADKKRPAVTKSLVSGKRPLFTDDGTSGYGTLFGEVVGASVGQVATGGTVLGPHTATGSGKVTLWDGPGIYGVTLDAVDTTASTGLVPTNTTIAGGAALYATSAGLLTPNVASAFEAVVVARFLEFSTTGSRVTTPNYLATAVNSPVGSGAALMQFSHAVIHFTGGFGA